jgi:long-subunit acyl-CoA synthetase (AMP-forming)
MKKLLTLTSIASTVAVLALIAACQTVATNQAETGASKKQNLLAQSGFKFITVTTPKQQQAVSQLAQGRVSAVKYNGKLYYVFPTTKKDQIFVGRQKQYNAYKQALHAQQGEQQMAGTAVFTQETAGLHNVEVQQFQGFGPMGVDALGNW